MIDNQTLEWINDYKTENSKHAATKTVNQFMKYLDAKPLYDFIDEISQDEKVKFRLINKFLNQLNLAPASVRQSYSFFKSYLRVVHGIKIDIEDRRQFIKFDAIPRVIRFPITKEIIKDLCMGANPVHKTFYLIQSSSGMRASESLALKEEYFNFNSKPVTIRLPADITKMKVERTAFISKEANASLQKNYEAYFGRSKKLNSFEQYFYHLRNRCGYLEKYENSINYKVNIHSLRAFFRTQSIKANINQDLAEELIGHTGYLKTYKRIDESDLIKAYLKLEPSLRIY
jgi:integrase